MDVLDLRPPAVNVRYRTADTLTVTFLWPTGSLTGRTFTAHLDDVTLTVMVAADVMTVTATATQTPAGYHAFRLTETTGGKSDEVIIGTWVGDVDASASTHSTVTVTTGLGQVTVNVDGSAALLIHEADDTAHGNPLGALATHEASTTAHGNPLGALATHEADLTAHGNPLGALATHEADLTAHGDPLGALSTHEADLTAHGNPLGALAAHIDKLHKPNVTVPAAWGDWWRTARDDAGSRIVRVQAWGDSISVGAGATNPQTQGFLELIGAALQSEYGDGGSGYIPWSMATATGTWTAGVGFGGGQGTATAAGTLTWSGLRGTQIRFWYQGLAVTGSFRWRVDGGSYTTVTTPTGALTQNVVVIPSLPDTAHTLEVERVSGTVVIYGAEARRSAGVIMQRCAQGGRAMSDYSPIPVQRLPVGATNGSTTITSTAPGAFNSSLVGRYITSTQLFNDTQITAVASATSATVSRAAGGTGTSQATISVNPGFRAAIAAETIQPAFDLIDGLEVPDVVIICLGANDGASADTNEVSWLDAAATILRPMTISNTLTFSPDVIVVIEHYGTWFDVNSQVPAIVAAHAQLAAGNGGALVDIWGMGRRSWAYWNSLGYFADAIHPSTTGHQQYAAPIIDLLTED